MQTYIFLESFNIHSAFRQSHVFQDITKNINLHVVAKVMGRMSMLKIIAKYEMYTPPKIQQLQYVNQTFGKI